ncbi:MAG: hypothetical protein MHPSP_002800, partial [Paramarteilia canceri]
ALCKTSKITSQTLFLSIIPSFVVMNDTDFEIDFVREDSNSNVTYHASFPKSNSQLIYFPKEDQTNIFKVKIKPKYREKVLDINLNRSSSVLVPIINQQNEEFYYIKFFLRTSYEGNSILIISKSQKSDSNLILYNLDLPKSLVVKIPYKYGHKKNHMLKNIDPEHCNYLFHPSLSDGNSHLDLSYLTKDFSIPLSVEKENEFKTGTVHVGSLSFSWLIVEKGIKSKIFFAKSMKTLQNICTNIKEVIYFIEFILLMEDVSASLIDEVSKNELINISFKPSKSIWKTQKEGKLPKKVELRANTELENKFLEFKRAGSKNLRLQLAKQSINFASGSQRQNREVDFRNLTYLDNSKKLIREKMPAILFGFKVSSSKKALILDLFDFQIDFFNSNNHITTILSRTSLPKSVIDRMNTIALLSLRAFIENESIFLPHFLIVNTVTFIMQEFDFKIDIECIKALYLYFIDIIYTENTNTELLNHWKKFNFTDVVNYIANDNMELVSNDCLYGIVDSKNEIFIRKMHIGPMRFNVAISLRTETEEQAIKSKTFAASSYGHLLDNKFLQTLGNFSDVSFSFNYVEITDDLVTLEALQNELLANYKSSLINQWYKVFFGLDIIGRPYKLVTNLAGGLQSLFYEPYKGATMSSSQFLEGVEL